MSSPAHLNSHSKQIASKSEEIYPGEATPQGLVCIVLFMGIVASYGALQSVEWQGSAQIHTETEELATVLALVVGLMAIVRYYSRRDSLLLLLGAAFIGTAVLDGYHAIVTSLHFKQYMPSDLPSLIPWSWIASRWYLSVALFASAIVWRLNLGQSISTARGEAIVYAASSLFTVSSLLFFLIYPLPQAYYPDIIIHRPEEFLPALFFFLALMGFAWGRDWAGKPTEYWLVLSLVVGLATQIVYMPFSATIFDLEFNIAHALKIVSYVMVFVGLLQSMHSDSQLVTTGENKLQQQSLLL